MHPGHWFFYLFPANSVALTVCIISLVGASGLALGSLKLRGISLGVPGVMFTGLLAARILGPGRLSEPMLNFTRDFGLILFVYAVGIQVGPGFAASLRKRGLPLNLMAIAIVLLGAAMSVGLCCTIHMDIKTAVGLFAGATTNAPALGAAAEAIKSIQNSPPGTAPSPVTGEAFAIAYPFGLLGVILAMIFVRAIFRIVPQAEADLIDAAEKKEKPTLHALNIEVKNPNLDGLTLDKIQELQGLGVVISRVSQKSVIRVARPDLRVNVGDVLLAVGPQQELSDLRTIAGADAAVDLRAVPSKILTRNVLVTQNKVLGTTVDELDLSRRFAVAITRISRAGMEFTAVGSLRLQFGDSVRLVGEADGIDAAAHELGDSQRALTIPRLLPIFVGIALGVTLGSIPIFLPGLPAPVKLGLAGGPMIVAIVLSRLGRIGRLIWYMPISASALLRELGIVLFLIAVGLQSGQGFFNKLFSTEGVIWLLLGAGITLIPLMLVAIVARKVFRLDYLHICGLLAGSMTSPSLAFVSTMTTSEAPAVAFATVYPLTMLLRILVAQLMVLIFAR
jgi:putative transport protein